MFEKGIRHLILVVSNESLPPHVAGRLKCHSIFFSQCPSDPSRRRLGGVDGFASIFEQRFHWIPVDAQSCTVDELKVDSFWRSDVNGNLPRLPADHKVDNYDSHTHLSR